MKLRFTPFWGAMVSVLVGSANVALASGFQIWEQSAAGTGDYHAGGAAEANDAGTEFYNPAGMIRLNRPEISVGGVYIPVSVAFNGTTGGSSTNGYVHGDTKNLVPNLHFVYPFLQHKLAFGFGITTPFGLTTNYPNGNLGVAQGGTVTKVLTINVNPSLAYAITPKWSIGVGGDVLYGRATYNSMITASDPFTNTLHDTALGWNAGTLYQVSPGLRFGVSYRSEIVLNAKGTSKSSVGGVNNNLRATLNLPATLTFSGFYNVTPKWDILGSAYHTQWDVFNNLVLRNTAFVSGGADIAVHMNYKNSWNFALGAHYHYTKKMLFKFGLGYDLTPTRDRFRDIRLPGNNRIALAIGVHNDFTSNLGFDFGWVHLFAKKVAVNNTGSGLFITSAGLAKMSANVFGTQLSYKF
jgi:long-chain fatty acid transport protein